MDFLKSLFGGTEQTTSSTSTSKPKDMTPDEYVGLRDPFAQSLLSMLTSSGGPSYTGPLNANITGNEQDLLRQLMGMTGAGTQRSGVIGNTLSGAYLPGGAQANPFLEAAIQAAQRPTLQGLEETLSRTLPGRFTQAGHFTQPQGSSAFDRAAAIATRGAADAMGDIATKMSFGAYESERGRQQEAISLDRAEVDTTISNLQAQALPRLIEELGIERGLQEFQRRTATLLDVLKTIAGVTTPTVANEQKSTSTGHSESQNGVFQALFPKGL